MVLPSNELPPRTAVMEMLRAAWIAPALYTMASLGIADHLGTRPRTVDELAAVSDTHAPTLSRLIRTLAAIGFCETDGEGVVRLTTRGELLRSDVPGSIRSYILAIHAPHIERAWDDLPAAVRSGNPSFPDVHGAGFWTYLATHPEEQSLFDGAMAGGADRRAQVLLETQDLSAMTTLVDVGGGNGILLAAALVANPALHGILFDRAEALSEAEGVLVNVGVRDRCDLIAGDFFTSVPAGGDAYVLALIIHDWPDEAAIDILRSCHRAMTPGAKVWIIEGVLEPDDTFDSQKLLDLLMLVLFGAQERTFKEYASLLEAAGFKDARQYRTGQGSSVIEGVRP